MSSNRAHWLVFNALARVVAWGFLVVGVGFAAWGLWLILHPYATVSVEGTLTRDPWMKATVALVGTIVAALGVLLLRARRYRPDEGYCAFSVRSQEVLQKRRFP